MGAYLISTVLPKTYVSLARVVVGQTLNVANPDASQIGISIALSGTYEEIASTVSFEKDVLERLGLDPEAATLPGTYEVSANRPPFIDIEARARDPEVAARIATAAADALVAIPPTLSGSDDASFLLEEIRGLEQQITETRAEITDLLATEDRTQVQEARLELLQNRLLNLRSTYAAYRQTYQAPEANRITIIDPALVPVAASSPQPMFNAIIAAGLALLIVLAVIAAIDRFDDRVRTPDDVGRLIGIPAIGQIAVMPGKGREIFYRLVALLYPRSPVAEAFRTVRTNIEFASIDERVRSIVVTSSVAGEGKSTIAANLAVVFAQGGRSTLLVDADLRRPAQDQLFRLPNEHGLTTLLVSEASIADVAQSTEQANLSVITTGPLPPNPAELLNSHRMEAVLERFQHAADIVLFDTPPVGPVTDAAILAVRADGTILVVRAGSTHEPAIRRGHEALTTVGARVLGFILNAVPSEIGQADAYYGNYRSGTAPATSPAPDPAPTTAMAAEAGRDGAARPARRGGTR